jgi:glycosyltransferase involved in cell wall biosynthesis
MKISVCMASFNGEAFIGEQIASILPQLLEGDELVISDDSSTDNTLDVVGSFDDKRIRVLAGNTFHDPIRNFENAIARSSGDVIILSDQDDVWLENKLAVIRTHFIQPGRPVRTLVSDGYLIDESGTAKEGCLFSAFRTGRFRNSRSGRGIIRNIYDNTYMGCCMAFSRELLKVALPFPKGIPMHDSWLGLLGEIYGSVEFLPVKTIKYRLHQQNRSLRRVRIGQRLRWRMSLVYQLSKRVLEYPPVPVVRRRLMQHDP